MTDPDQTGPAPLPHLAPAGQQRDRRLGALRVLVGATDPMAITDVAERLHCHPNSARSHLDALVGDGLATRTTVASGGRGRPHYRYAAVAGADAALTAVETSDLVMDEYRGLVAAFATVLRSGGTGMPRETARAVGNAWARALPVPRGRGAPRRRVVELLTRLGFSPRPGRPAAHGADGVRSLVELRTCPLLDVASEFPDVICQVHHGLIETAHVQAGGGADGVDLVPFAAPGACHVLLPPDGPEGDAPRDVTRR